jgi:hypothetical protein
MIIYLFSLKNTERADRCFHLTAWNSCLLIKDRGLFFSYYTKLELVYCFLHRVLYLDNISIHMVVCQYKWLIRTGRVTDVLSCGLDYEVSTWLMAIQWECSKCLLGLEFGLWCLRHYQQYFSHILEVSFIGGGNNVHRENHRPTASHWQTLSCNVVSSISSNSQC